MYDVTTALDTLPFEFSSRQAATAGLSYDVVDRLVRRNAMVRVQPGIFRRRPPRSDAPHWAEVRDEHLRRVRLALLAHPRHAASHDSAAAMYDWPVRLHPDAPVDLTALDVQPRSRREPGLVLHHSDSMINEVEDVDGRRALTRARTLADCLRTHRPPTAVAIVDGALRTGQVSGAEVRQALDAQRRWVGRPRARRSLQLVDPRRESWLESYSFVTLHEHGIELPLSQVEVFDASYTLVARVDGLWLRQGTVGEADGAAKYVQDDWRKDVGPPELAARRVVAERRRERDLTDLGLAVVRWTTDEITKDPPQVARRVVSAWQRAVPTTFTGHLRHDGSWLDLPARRPPAPFPTEHRPSGE